MPPARRIAARQEGSTRTGMPTGPCARSTTERGWEAEFAIPLKTLRYNPGDDRTWGVNVMRNIRRKNEQVFLSPVPRGYNLHRVSVAGKLSGLSLPTRRDLKFVPYVAGSVNDDKTLRTDTGRSHGRRRARRQMGRARRPDARRDGQHRLRAGRGRRAAGEPDAVPALLPREAAVLPRERADSFSSVSRRRSICSSRGGSVCRRPASRSTSSAGGRLSGKLGGYNVGLLNMQTDDAVNDRTGETIAPANNFTVMRLQREVGRSNFGAMFVNRQGVGRSGAGRRLQPRLRTRSRLAGDDERQTVRLHGPHRFAAAQGRIRLCRARLLLSTPTSCGAAGSATRRSATASTPRSASCSGAATGRSKAGTPFQLPAEAVAVDPPYPAALQLPRVHGSRQQARELWTATCTSSRSFTARARRFGYLVDMQQDRPAAAVHRVSGRHGPARGHSGRRICVDAGRLRRPHRISARRSACRCSSKIGTFYDGDYYGWEADHRAARRRAAHLVVGWNRDDITLPGGSFTNDLVPIKVSYSFTSLASLQGLIQYNRQTSTISSNIRLALLNRSGTGCSSSTTIAATPRPLTPRRAAGPIVHRQIHAAV